jgi:hypothetical protein
MKEPKWEGSGKGRYEKGRGSLKTCGAGGKGKKRIR